MFIDSQTFDRSDAWLLAQFQRFTNWIYNRYGITHYRIARNCLNLQVLFCAVYCLGQFYIGLTLFAIIMPIFFFVSSVGTRFSIDKDEREERFMPPSPDVIQKKYSKQRRRSILFTLILPMFILYEYYSGNSWQFFVPRLAFIGCMIMFILVYFFASCVTEEKN